ncbi:MAG TPA: hypothetical protein VGO00_21945 [Kofleriaceae bacterium]|nr:hypothetical protein [Kofleriaceae bacterium]
MARAYLVLVILAGACDSKATASDPLGGGRSEQRSKEYESCSASSQCGDDLRCFEHTCRRTNRSTVGDYYAARGALLRTRGDSEGAVEAYTQALGHYDTEKLALPPDIDCAYGAALAGAKGKKEHVELGARVLHRCLLAVPVGSGLRDRALAELATLSDAGLDPLALGRNQPADVYLTKSAARPATDKLAITATGTPAVPAKSATLINDKLAEADLRNALVGCWDTYNTATKKDVLSVTIAMKSAYIASEYTDDPDAAGSFVLKIDPAANLPAGPDATADGCVRGVVEPAIKSLAIRDQFSTKLAIAIK